MNESIPFPRDFLWGVATSAYQIEGCPLADGAGPNIWHRFAHEPGMTVAGHTGDVACDHYNRYADDVKLMSDLGIGAYRFSTAWARVLPRGRGRVNAKGLAFYDRLIDSLLARDIRPFVTLYHWDLPLELENRGGWLNDDTSRWFGDYADLMFRAFSDRVPYWMTINEPAVIMEKGYVLGVYAPGHRNIAEAPTVARNLLRAHGYAVQAYRDRGDGCIGIAVNIQPKYPASQSVGDQAAARRANAWRNLQFLDAILLGSTPDELPEMFGREWKVLTAEDLKLIHQPIDYVGLNYYTRVVVGEDAQAPPLRARVIAQDSDTTLIGWEIYPEGLTQTLLTMHERYHGIPIYITECGAAFKDPPPDADGDIHDPERVEFFRSHIRAAMDAYDQGVDLRGFFVWSLLDNFEWNSGYTMPFGIVHVDFETQRRTVKTSGRFFAEVARSNGAILLTQPEESLVSQPES
ncbi:MAG TPA: GH1 family beta-glucosidase [Gemmatimonadaceae bacterium]|nr:GH1 family beta-glucosidase [Gemmatimonadaceae bacterium]